MTETQGRYCCIYIQCIPSEAQVEPDQNWHRPFKWRQRNSDRETKSKGSARCGKPYNRLPHTRKTSILREQLSTQLLRLLGSLSLLTYISLNCCVCGLFGSFRASQTSCSSTMASKAAHKRVSFSTHHIGDVCTDAHQQLTKEYVSMQKEPPPFVWAVPDEKNILTCAPHYPPLLSRR